MAIGRLLPLCGVPDIVVVTAGDAWRGTGTLSVGKASMGRLKPRWRYTVMEGAEDQLLESDSPRCALLRSED